MAATRAKGAPGTPFATKIWRSLVLPLWKVFDPYVAPYVADTLACPGKQQGPWLAPRALSEILGT
jgi:hypothetical protein